MPAPDCNLLNEWLRRTARERPHAPAIEDDGRITTFDQLCRQAEALALQFIAHGLRPGDRVALLLPKSTGSIVAVFASLFAGAAYVPIHPRWPQERVQAVLRDCGARLLIEEQNGALRITDLETGALLRDPQPLGDREAWPRLDPSATAVLLFTSGSTGVPKGAEGGNSFGVLKVDAQGAVENFLEKPARPPGMPGSPDYSLASMGVYLFRARTLVEEVIKDAKKKSGKHDFGADIIPQMVGRKQVFAYNFADAHGTPRYWRDIGLLDAYFQAHSDLLGAAPTFDLFDRDWPMRGRPQLLPPSRFITSPGACLAVGDSLIASGCIIEGTVNRAVLSPGVKIGHDATIEDAVLWDGVELGPGASIKRAIIEDGVKIPANFHIGADRKQDAKRFHVTENGIVVVPNNVILEE